MNLIQKYNASYIFRAVLKQGEGRFRTVYAGIATGRNCKSFWPMIPGENNVPKVRKIYIEMQSGQPLADGHYGGFDLNSMFPNFITMR